MGYRGKTVEQEQARALRAEGLTLQEIAGRLGVSKSSVSLWVRGVAFTPRPCGPRARQRAPNALQRRKQQEIDDLLAEGAARIGRLSEREFLVAGAMLYAAEGSKGDGSVKLANSDPRMVAFHCSWLRTFFTVEEHRLRVHLYLHEGLDLEAATAFWSSLTGIPPSQFGKPYRAVPDASIRHNKHLQGCPSVSYACSRTHRAVTGLFQALLTADTLPG